MRLRPRARLGRQRVGSARRLALAGARRGYGRRRTASRTPPRRRARARAREPLLPYGRAARSLQRRRRRPRRRALGDTRGLVSIRMTKARPNELEAFHGGEELNVIIETPKGSRNKFNYDEEL